MRYFALLISLLCATLLVACADTNDQQELEQWIGEQRRAAKPKVTPIAEPKKFTPQPYTQAGAMDPFNNQKLTQALKRDAEQAKGSMLLVAPELRREPEPLEAFPLDIMTMTGTLTNRKGQAVALIRVENNLEQVRVGQHLGTNYGRVLRITEKEVVLREIVQDATGEWIERMTRLQLQEKAK